VYDRIERAERNKRIQEGRPWGPTVVAEVRKQHEEANQRAMAEAMSAVEAETRMIEEPEPLTYGELVGGHGGLTALLHAAREGHAETAFALLEGGADIDQVSAGDGTSPMLMATINGHYDLAMRFLERGADPKIASHAGATPLFAAINTHWAPKSRYPQQHIYMQQDHTYLEVMRKLLDAGVDPNVQLAKHLWFMSFNFDLLQIDARGATPFWRAAYALDVEAMHIDLLSISAHKLYGPKGAGALYVRSRPRVRLVGQIDGGGHEKGMRSGTLNVPGIVGMGEACALAQKHIETEAKHSENLRHRLQNHLFNALPRIQLNGHPEQRLPGNLNISFAGVDGESLLMSLRDVALSSGSACTSASLEPSYVLKAIGVSNDMAQSSIRFGIGRFNNEAEIAYVA